jgi:YidC/Oxa1 family membrane protein insertase
MERRLLVAILLTFVVLTVYQYLVPTPPPAATAQPGQTSASTTPTPAPSQQATPPAAAASEEAAPAIATLKSDAVERTITVDNGVVRATFSNRGATLVSWQLTNYQGTGQAIDLVPQGLPGDPPKPFSLRLPDAGKSARLNRALFATDQGATFSANLEARNAPVTVRFEYQDAAGLQARKEFRLEPNSYVITFSTSVTDGATPVNPLVQWGPGLGDVLALAGRGAFGTPVRRAEGIYSAGRSVSRLHADALQKQPRYQSAYEFAGVDTHYFISVAIQPGNAELEYHPLSIPGEGSATREYVGYDIRFNGVPSGPSNARFFFGPKHFDTLKATDPDLVRAIWFGMFSFLSVPLLSALNWVNG